MAKGIERATTLLMPALFVLLLALSARAISLPRGIDGLTHLFTQVRHFFRKTLISGYKTAILVFF